LKTVIDIGISAKRKISMEVNIFLDVTPYNVVYSLPTFRKKIYVMFKMKAAGLLLALEQ
jgi:hypothetical protein